MQTSECILVKPQRFSDNRGFFSEIYSRKRYSDLGIRFDFVQDDHSLSKEVGTVRGLHFQQPPYSETKIVSCLKGEVWDVAVDLRSIKIWDVRLKGDG
mgnify:CR=1 FL=1